MVARVATASKCREKPKELILAEEPEGVPPPYVPPGQTVNSFSQLYSILKSSTM
jgi:hypothetical protein